MNFLKFYAMMAIAVAICLAPMETREKDERGVMVLVVILWPIAAVEMYQRLVEDEQ